MHSCFLCAQVEGQALAEGTDNSNIVAVSTRITCHKRQHNIVIVSTNIRYHSKLLYAIQLNFGRSCSNGNICSPALKRSEVKIKGSLSYERKHQIFCTNVDNVASEKLRTWHRYANANASTCTKLCASTYHCRGGFHLRTDD